MNSCNSYPIQQIQASMGNETYSFFFLSPILYEVKWGYQLISLGTHKTWKQA